MRARVLSAATIVIAATAAAVAALATAAAPPPPPPPTTFVGVSPTNAREDLSVYSSATGARVQDLTTFGLAFTNNGLARSPDGGSVYYTLIPHTSKRRFALKLMRIDVATDRSRFVADGWQPAVSDSGTQLAYGAVPHGLAVRDLATGATRTVSLVKLLGPAANLLNASVTWLADGTDVAVLASAPARVDAGASEPPATPGTCLGQAHAAIVFVHVPPAPQRLSARCTRALTLTPPGAILGGDGAHPSSLLLAAEIGPRTVIERITQSGDTTRLLTIANSLPLAIDRSGAHLLYLLGHSPPALWEGAISGDQLIDRSRLIANADVGALAW
jgi:hypothetical protein